MKENIVKPMIYQFAVNAVKLCKQVEARDNEFDMTRQLRRSATGINANYAEAEYAASKADFINKLNVCLKEANESVQWLNMLKDTEYISVEEFTPLYDEGCKIVKIMKSAILTLKNKEN